MNDTAERLRNLWNELLDHPAGAEDLDFFSLGGQSLIATRLIGRITEELGVQLRLRDVFDHPTLASLGVLVDAARERTRETGARAADDAPADGPVRLAHPPLRPYGAPLAPLQERFWKVERVLPQAAFFNQVMRVDLTGDLDRRLLMSALRGTVRRHDVLRATLEEGPDGPRQTVRPDFTVPVRQREYGDLDEAAREEVIRRAAKAESRLPFDLVREIPLRLRVLRFTATRSAVLVVTHHIAFDGWSRGQLVADVAAHYRARVEGTAAPEPLAYTYTDFAAWQAGHRAAGGMDASRAYWLDRLAPPYPDLRLPGALDDEDEYRSATQPVAVPAAALASVARLARRENTTDFTVLLAVFLLAVASRCGAPETMAAIQVANRRWPGTQKLVGLFSNTLVLRAPIDPAAPFEAYLRTVRAALLEAFDHQDVPLEEVVDALRERDGIDLADLLQVGFALQDPWVPETPVPGGLLRQASGLAVGDDQELDPTTFGLTMELRADGPALCGYVTYKADRYPPDVIKALVATFDGILRTVTEEPCTAVGPLVAEQAAL
ncbi:putative non-ribosomal peptide synthetase [Actinacidiphila reveromycinica]|uniref:Putative non-ribosomal peptide synthetase n=1 Tax=Actinacidiphila reveromycinica TaxID=659352 RepID=A0A7U3V004_9ACTN|nr:condensation domain-containing protein [Streptomyces sp. SN-593]BBB01988.1 putative non-ribosomal peptide synthetase [Streptomyces sp. SN-593]